VAVVDVEEVDVDVTGEVVVVASCYRREKSDTQQVQL
jgi:hypothetical protein